MIPVINLALDQYDLMIYKFCFLSKLPNLLIHGLNFLTDNPIDGFESALNNFLLLIDPLIKPLDILPDDSGILFSAFEPIDPFLHMLEHDLPLLQFLRSIYYLLQFFVALLFRLEDFLKCVPGLGDFLELTVEGGDDLLEHVVLAVERFDREKL